MFEKVTEVVRVARGEAIVLDREENDVDQLAIVKAKIAELKEVEKKLESQFKAQLMEGNKKAEITGKNFKVIVTRNIRNSTSWKAVAEDAGYSDEDFERNTKQSEFLRLDVKAYAKG